MPLSCNSRTFATRVAPCARIGQVSPCSRERIVIDARAVIFAHRNPATGLWIQACLLRLIQTCQRTGDPTASLHDTTGQSVEVVLPTAKRLFA